MAYYRAGLAANEITGLKKALAEKRIEEIGKADMSAMQSAPLPMDGSKLKWKLSSRFSTPRIESFKLENGAEIEFCACPAGKFKMSNINGKGVHKVSITRPFWISKQFLSEALICDLPESKKSNVEELQRLFPDFNVVVLPLGTNIMKHCAMLNDKYRQMLPNGYVFRIPTEAELEYAVTAGAGLHKDKVEHQLDHLFTKEIVQGKGYDGKIVYDQRIRLFPKATINKWGLTGVAWTFSSQIVLDTIDTEAKGAMVDNQIKYGLNEVDPLRVGNKLLGREKGVGRHVKMSLKQGYCRLVIGPDLVSEWRAKNKKK